MALSEFQSHSLTNSAQNNLELSIQLCASELQQIQKAMKLSLLALTDGTLKESENMQECLCVRYCNGVIGVPITFLDKYNPNQFNIIDLNPHFFSIVAMGLEKPKQLTLKNANKKDPYARVLIKRKV